MTSEGAVLEGLVEHAAQTMQRLSGGMAVCTFTRAGKAVPGIKYAEGRWAALRETHRKVSAGQGLGEVVPQVITTWQSGLVRARERNAGADWIAYYTGGLDALAEVTEPCLRPIGNPLSSSDTVD